MRAAFAGAPYSVGAIVTPTTYVDEAEEHIANDPTNPSNLVATITDLDPSTGIQREDRVAYSIDGGDHWQDSVFPRDAQGNLATGDGVLWLLGADPVVAMDSAGNVFVAQCYAAPVSGTAKSQGLYVSVAQPSGATLRFTSAGTIPVVPSSATDTSMEDKEWIAVDNGSSPFAGNVYISWTHFDGFATSGIRLSRSTDQGRSWSAPVDIDSPTAYIVQGSQVATGPLGEVYVVHEAMGGAPGGQGEIRLTKSLDGGASFSRPHAITPPYVDLMGHVQASYRVNSLPAFAVDRSSGALYALYSDDPGGGAQVEFIRSTDGGATFSAPVAINDAPQGDHFMPAIAVDELGTIHASWFDSRLNATSDRYDIFATRSTDGGATFAPNARVTPASIDATGVSFIGDYCGLAAAGGVAHPVWNSGGGNRGQLQTTTLR